MASAWKVAAATAVVGWLMSPVISLVLPKIFSRLVFDPSKKLLELKICVIPELEDALHAVDQQRMLERGNKAKSVVSTLDEMAAMLRHAREDAEDIFDDAQEKIELYRNRCWQRLYGPVKASIAAGYGVVRTYIVLSYGAVKACIARCLEIVSHGSWHDVEIDMVAQSLAVMQNVLQAACEGDATQLQRRDEWVNALANLQHRLETASRDDAIRICKAEWADKMANLQEFLRSASVRDDATQMRDEVIDWLQKELAGTMMGSFYDAVAACKSSIMWLLHLAPNCFKEPVEVNADQTASQDHLGVAIDIAGSHQQALTAAPSSSSYKQAFLLRTVLSESWCGSSDDFLWWSSSDSSGDEPEATPSCNVFNNHCRSIVHRLVDAYEKACFYRDCSYAGAGITSNQENTHVLDFALNAISRQNLKKRIDKVESTVSELKKSPLLSIASKSAPVDIANKNRSKIRTASNRKVFGREAFRDFIMAKLRETTDCDAASSSTSPCYSVIGIYGVAGSGKTTFAQYTRDYIKEECKEKRHFDTIICIHVTERFTVDDIFHEMLKDITKDRHSNISDHEELEEKLKESLCGKRFCLILDDLWVNTKNDPQIEELISPLNVGLRGSKILVTARTKVSAGALSDDEPIEIPDLDEDQYLSMFMHYALGSMSVVDEEFIQVGRVIAEKLHRSPIAAVIVAGRLGSNRDIKVWKNTAELHILNDTMEALWWSYQQLSPDIRRCFEYCNVFPRRFKMKKGNLVHLWIAQGFLKTSYVTEDMEDVAERYIQELVSYSFLQQEKTYWQSEEFFKIHDLLHDLADIVTGTDYATIENDSSQRGEGGKGIVSQDVRHLFIQNYDGEFIIKKILGLENLVTLIINVVGNDTPVEEKVIESICKKLPKLPVLALALSKDYFRTNISIPESISQLKHLRYLAFKVGQTCRITLPNTLNKLHHIQLLDFGAGDISEFTFAELVNLRHLFCGPYVLRSYFGRLSSLQTTPRLIVSNDQGSELKQLRELNKLRGKLTICGLENVETMGQALSANLADKRLTKLILEWDYNDDTRCSPEVEAEVLAGLCLSAGPKKLAMWYFAGWRYLRNHNDCLKHLQELCLSRCSQPEHSYGLVEAFPHLLVLDLFDCGWDALPGEMENLTSLKDMSIISCKRIFSLPTLPRSLEKFHLYQCDHGFMKSCTEVGHSNWQMIKHIPIKEITFSKPI